MNKEISIYSAVEDILNAWFEKYWYLSKNNYNIDTWDCKIDWVELNDSEMNSLLKDIKQPLRLTKEQLSYFDNLSSFFNSCTCEMWLELHSNLLKWKDFFYKEFPNYKLELDEIFEESEYRIKLYQRWM